MTTQGTSDGAFAIVRLDWFQKPILGFLEGDGPDIGAGPVEITIKEIVMSEDEARAEVERLNALNAPKGCRYYWQQTRLFSRGGSFGAEERARNNR
jgi:hypothetical protein